jgi:hypothetical protein
MQTQYVLVLFLLCSYRFGPAGRAQDQQTSISLRSWIGACAGIRPARDSVCPGYLPNTSLAMVANCMLEVPS